MALIKILFIGTMTSKLYTLDTFIYFKDDSFFTLIMLVNIYLFFTNLKIISQDVL